MCFGGIFDIFLYELSREKQVISMEPIQVGGDALPPVFHVNTCAAALAPFSGRGRYSNFELEFTINPRRPRELSELKSSSYYILYRLV